MKNINYTLLISPPGGGKSTWLKNNSYDIQIDDISVIPNALILLEQNIKEKLLKCDTLEIAIADITLSKYELLEKAWHKLTEIAQNGSQKVNIQFNHILFVGEKEDYLRNVEKRNDSRNVSVSIDIYAPLIKKLVEKPFSNKNIIDITQYEHNAIVRKKSINKY